jgi:glycosyltransferase involved in cell wall biosynthesis
MPEISVIICTHNPRPEYLRRVLAALEAQTLPKQEWEFLLIDNASQERLAQSWDLGWHPQSRHIREDEPGLTPARLRGIKEATGRLLIFVDDDNVLAASFLATARSIASEHPYLGVFGAGILEPEFEQEPAPELAPQLWRLALRRVPAVRWSNNTEDFDSLPWGAGLCVKRCVAEIYPTLLGRLNITSLLGRRGTQLFCGEDDVFSWASVLAGQGFGVFPELRVTHLISAGRLTQAYFLRLIRDHAFSHGVLAYLRTGIQRPRMSRLGYARLLLQGIRQGRFPMKCQWMASRGAEQAERFIREHRLQPVSSGRPDGASAAPGLAPPPGDRL